MLNSVFQAFLVYLPNPVLKLILRMKLGPIITFLLIFSTVRLPGQNNADSSFVVTETLARGASLFSGDGIFDIILKFDISEYRKKKDDQEYMDALISFFSDGDTITKKIKLRSRGEFRRKFCDMPPIMLNFDLDDSTNDDFHNINKLKMVTVCPEGKTEYLLKEFLTYKLYSVLTPESYRVRLLRVNYVNTARQGQELTDFAFVIEPVELLARRIESVEVKTTNLSQKNVKPELMDRVAIFNYMIGNTDWSVPIAHNVQLFAQYNSEHPDLAVIVPFDFDFAGIVNTHYAAPFHTLNINSIRERQYIGMCRDKDTFLKALAEFSDHKDDFYKVINEFPWLDVRSKEDMIYYLDGFFEDLRKAEAMARTLLQECLRF